MASPGIHFKSWTRIGRYLLFASLLVDVFVIPPLVAMGSLPPWSQVATFSLTTVVALYALGARGFARLAVVVVGVVAVFARWIHFVSGLAAIHIAQALSAGIAAGVFAGVLLSDAFKRKARDRLLAVLLAYILLGFAWANAYVIAEVLHPGATSLPGKSRFMSEFIYFSFVTLTSVGYGDIVPVHPIARSLAALEALAGQIFLVAVVSRFVGSAVAPIREE